MSRQDANAAFARTSFLYGGNARYLDDLYAGYAADPASVDAEWGDFFQSLKDEGQQAREGADGPSWKRADWPAPARDELTSALDGGWTAVEKGLGDKIKSKAQPRGV